MSTTESESSVMNGFVLPTDGTIFEVRNGAVNLFYESVLNETAASRRRYLMTIQPGQCVFASLPSEFVSKHRWIVSPIGQASWIKKTVNDEELNELVQRWLSKLLESCETKDREQEVVVCGSASTIMLQPGQAFQLSPGQFESLCLETGSASLFGTEPLPTGKRCLVTSPCWFIATEVSTLHLESMHPDRDAASNIEKLENTHALVCNFLTNELQKQQLDQLQRQRLRTETLNARTNTTLRQIGAAIDSRTTRLIDEADPLMMALRQLEPELKCHFVSSDWIAPGRTVELEEIAHASRVRLRRVLLRPGWRKADAGPMLGYLGPEGTPVALLFRRGSYRILDRSGEQQNTQWKDLHVEATSFFRSFPNEKLTVWILSRYAFHFVRRDLKVMVCLVLLGAMLGLVFPIVTGWIVDVALPQADASLLLQLGLMLIAVTVATRLMDITEGLISLRMQTRIVTGLQATVWDRLLRLPMQFYRRFSSGDLLNRAMMVTEIGGEIGLTTITTLLNSISGLAALLLLVYYRPSLAMIAVVVALVSSISTAFLSLAIRRRALLSEEMDGQLFGFVVNAIQGISKLRIAGAEPRIFNAWAMRYGTKLQLESRIMLLEAVGRMINLALPVLGTLAVFVVAVPALQSNMVDGEFSLGTFLAFSTAFGIFVASVTEIAGGIIDMVDVFAKQRLVMGLLEEPEEQMGTVHPPGRLVGRIEVRNLSFRYKADGPLILNRISINVEPGQFVAIVGPSGSGKSTLMRLLLGFDRPESGSILYDENPIDNIDLELLRQQIGSVMQSSKLAAAPILDNIGAGRMIRLEDAWAALEDAGLASDVRAMPMSIHTLVSEGGSNLSGGQRQRLMIARALARRPRVLFFDEATSALDNITQASVSNAIARRNTSRVVIAHRLSTIRSADYVYVIRDGQIVDHGRPSEISELSLTESNEPPR